MTTRILPFRAILVGLLALIAQVAAQDRARAPFLGRAITYLNRRLQRLEALLAHWRANTLPRPCNPRPGRPRYPSTAPRFPEGHAWLLRAVDHHNARASASQLQHLLATPDCAEFLAAIPRAARILRPLARALGLQMPGDPPPKPPKPARPAPRPRPLPWLRPQHRIAAPSPTARDPHPLIFSKAR